MAKRACLDKEDEKSLVKRYLFWLYKTTKDETDKIDRKFTQLDIDRRLQKILNIEVSLLNGSLRESIAPFLNDWKEYIFQKESDAQKLKFNEAGQLDAKYVFLHLKLKAIRHSIELLFGRRGFRQFRKLYEEAAMKGILADSSGKR